MVFIKFVINFFTIFILALALSADDFSIGIAYGLFKTRISVKTLLIMVLGSAVSTYGIMLIGKFVFTSMPSSVTAWLSAIILAAIGIKMLYQGLKEKCAPSEVISQKSPHLNGSKSVGFFETFLVGLGLGVDDFAQALGLSLAGFPVILTVFVLELAEMLAILGGNYLAYKGFSKKVNGNLTIIPGIVLLMVAVWQIIA